MGAPRPLGRARAPPKEPHRATRRLRGTACILIAVRVQRDDVLTKSPAVGLERRGFWCLSEWEAGALGPLPLLGPTHWLEARSAEG